MTDEEKAMVAALNKRLMSKCACHCDADDNIVVDEMCLEHRMMIDDARKQGQQDGAAALAREEDANSQLSQAVRFADEWMRGLPTLSEAQDKDRHAARKALRTSPTVRALLDE